MLEFLVAVLLLELTPGPNMGYLATLSLQRGWQAGLAVVVGVAAGLAVHAVLAALGVGSLIAASPRLYEILRWAGVLFLVYLAWEGWRGEAERSPGHADPDGHPNRLFFDGFVANVLNPKSMLFFVSVMPQFVASAAITGRPQVDMLALGLIYVAIATLVHTSIVLAAARLRPVLVAGRNRDLVRKCLSLALLMVAIWLAFSTRRG